MLGLSEWAPNKRIRGVLEKIVYLLNSPCLETPLNSKAAELYKS